MIVKVTLQNPPNPANANKSIEEQTDKDRAEIETLIASGRLEMERATALLQRNRGIIKAYKKRFF